MRKTYSTQIDRETRAEVRWNAVWSPSHQSRPPRHRAVPLPTCVGERYPQHAGQDEKPRRNHRTR